MSLNLHPTHFRRWVKRRETPLARALYGLGMWLRYANMPVIPGVHRGLYHLTGAIANAWRTMTRTLWYTPLFQSQLTTPSRRLYLYGGIPFIVGAVSITLGEGCRIAGHTSIMGRTSGDRVPELIVGDNVDIGWDSTLAVGRRIEIGNNVRLAAGVQLLGYPGHPIDAATRATGAPETDDQVGDIVLEDDVWLATRVMVMSGVRIGRGTIVAAGSVVTRDLPPGVIAAGVPAVVKRKIGAS